jgi:hypothetical protein
MDEQAVRDRAQSLCDALVAGDIDTATADFSKELRANLGEVIALLPLPSTAAEIDSVEHGYSGYGVVLRLTGESEEVMLQTRWKDREGHPTVVEASHLSRAVTEPPVEEASEGAADAAGAADGEPA